MAKINWKPGAMLAPLPPMLVSCGSIEEPNVCTVGWCGVLSSYPPKTYISLRPERYSHEIISKTKEFVINLPVASLIRTIDYCGVKSGRDENKFETRKLTPEASIKISAPGIAECPVSIECRVEQIIPMGSHDMFMAEIISVNVDENIIDSTGRLRLAKAGLACYAHGEYFALGKKIGDFGFSVKKKKKNYRPANNQKSRPKRP